MPEEKNLFTVVVNQFTGMAGNCRHYEIEFVHIERKTDQTLRQAMEENQVWTNSIAVVPGHLSPIDY